MDCKNGLKPLDISKDGFQSYGTISSPNSTFKKITYCVHGFPNEGCCTISFSEGGDTSLAFQEKNMFSIAENTNPLSGSQFDGIDRQHCHEKKNQEVDKKAKRKLIIASVLCLIFMIAEIIGGYLSSSLAIATDAAHLLTDFASFMISLFSLWLASRPPTRRMSFGWYRAEVIGALTSVLLIWAVTAILVYLAIQRLIEQQFEIDATIMLITSSIGIVVNLIMGLSLHQHGHSHGPNIASNHSHQNIEEEQLLPYKHSHAENVNVRAALIHVIGDLIQSFGVFVAAVVIYYKPEWNIIDPICTFLFSILVLATTLAIIKDTLLVLMEGMPKDINYNDVMNTFLHIDGVNRVHNLRIWALSLDKTAISAHLAILPGINPLTILTTARKFIHEKYNFYEMTLQIEEFEDNMENCTQCKPPVA